MEKDKLLDAHAHWESKLQQAILQVSVISLHQIQSLVPTSVGLVYRQALQMGYLCIQTLNLLDIQKRCTSR